MNPIFNRRMKQNDDKCYPKLQNNTLITYFEYAILF